MFLIDIKHVIRVRMNSLGKKHYLVLILFWSERELTGIRKLNKN